MNVDRILLLSTTDCTLNCDYCYMKLGTRKYMSSKVAIDAVNWAFSNASGPRLSVEFFGGDPLLNLDIIDPVISHAIKEKEKYKDINRFWFTAFLNGYNKNLNKFLDIVAPYKDLFHTQFSMDGCKEAQDCGRRTRDGKSSFDEAVKSIEIVKKRLNKVNIHAVITPDNIKYLNKSIDFVLSTGSTHLEFGIERDNRWTEESLAIFDSEIKIAADRFIEWMKCGKKISFSLLVNPIHAIINGKETGCYIGRTGVLIGHDGKIYPCQSMEKHGDKVCMGDIYSGVKKESEDFWKSVKCHNMSACKKCTLYGICIGSCAGANYEYNGTPLIPIKNSCLLYKTIYREAIRVFNECKDYPLYRDYMNVIGSGWKKKRGIDGK